MSVKTIAIIAALLLLGMGFNIYQKRATPEATLTPITIPRTQAKPSTTPTLTIYVTGAVYHSGIYHIAPDSRVSDVIALAGGTKPDANLEKINLAAKLKDGQRVLVATKKTTKTIKKKDDPFIPIHINHASREILAKVPGISSRLANDIITFRDKNGPFTHIDELTQIKGIGAKTIEKWRPYLRL
jgi:competence protein ComEA